MRCQHRQRRPRQPRESTATRIFFQYCVARARVFQVLIRWRLNPNQPDRARNRELDRGRW